VVPYFIRPAGTTVEVWSGYRIQFGGFEKHNWQKELKAQLRQVFTSLAIPVGVPFAGYYDTTNPAVSDTENSLFTNLRESMPKGITWLRFEHGTGAPPRPPVQIDLVGGHLHYYRYEFGRQWTTWEQTRHWHAGTASHADSPAMDPRDRPGTRYAMPTPRRLSPS
jgi:hypothetical protein